MNTKNKIIALGALLGASVLPSFAAYADVDAVVTAVTGIPTSATAAFLAAAGLGVAFLIVRLVSKALKKGMSVG